MGASAIPPRDLATSLWIIDLIELMHLIYRIPNKAPPISEIWLSVSMQG
jgi:hypothetical protein